MQCLYTSTLLLVAWRAAVVISRLTACNRIAFEGGNLDGTPRKTYKVPKKK